jgi:hypothetical protein|tara:strand:+ start:3166 stop:3621 length:456 start_codon:yes stop_codon:yes gene_type:complete
MRKWLIRKLGGHISLLEAIEDIEDRREKHRILTMALKKTFNTISADDILKENNGKWFFKGRALSDAQRKLLVAEAQQFINTKLWQVVKEDTVYRVYKKMYLLAENDLHVITAKFWKYAFDTIETRLKSIAKDSGIFNKNDTTAVKKADVIN